jgi:hypothetical protein
MRKGWRVLTDGLLSEIVGRILSPSVVVHPNVFDLGLIATRICNCKLVVQPVRINAIVTEVCAIEMLPVLRQ